MAFFITFQETLMPSLLCWSLFLNTLLNKSKFESFSLCKVLHASHCASSFGASHQRIGVANALELLSHGEFTDKQGKPFFSFGLAGE